jgi:predicted P-loop ATPase/GTPase
MSDIVIELRNPDKLIPETNYRLMNKAATEIEQLRGLINDLRDAIDRAVEYNMNKEARDILCDALDWF